MSGSRAIDVIVAEFALMTPPYDAPLDISACWCTHCHTNLAVEVAVPRSVYIAKPVPTCAECMSPWSARDVLATPNLNSETCTLM